MNADVISQAIFTVQAQPKSADKSTKTRLTLSRGSDYPISTKLRLLETGSNYLYEKFPFTV